MKSNKIFATFVSTICAVFSSQLYATDQCDNSSTTSACIQQVNLEDMRVKSGEVVTSRGKTEIKLRVEDQAATRGRPIYGRDVYIDVTSLQGQDGSDGINGDTGSQGEQGIAGKQGEKGDQGMTGLDGKQGEKGEKGVADEEKLQEIADGITNNRTDITKNTTSITELKDEMFNSNTKSINSENSMNQRIDGVMNDMRYMDKNLSAGIASSIAIGQHQFDPSFKGGQVSLSGGFYNGQNAVSLAVGVPVGERAFLSASIAADSGSYGESGGVGITIQLP